MVRLNITTPPNWGDFKAFTTLPRRFAAFMGADVASMRLVIALDGQEVSLKVGGPVLRFAKKLRARVSRPLPVVQWNGIWVVGIPVRNGHALFRAFAVNPRRDVSEVCVVNRVGGTSRDRLESNEAPVLARPLVGRQATSVAGSVSV
jgi:hypothetical protein